MRKLLTISTLALSVIIFGGCAVGQKYNYNTNAYALPIKGERDLQVVVKDERPYVLSGDKDPNFVGLQRGGWGNPFNVTTASGKPLADDVAASLSRSLAAKGYDVKVLTKLEDATAERVVLLRMLEWKTDIYSQITLHFDLVLQIRDQSGKVIAEKSVSGKEPIGGAKMSSDKNASSATEALANRIGSLFLDPGVSNALK